MASGNVKNNGHNIPKLLPSIDNDELKLDSDHSTKDARMSWIKKEKSRDAARSRRGRENCEFYALATLLPISDDASSQLDKASIIRLTICYLQLRQFFWKNMALTSTQFKKSHDSTSELPNVYLSVALQSLDGFLVVVNTKGRCLYVSSSVSEDLGLPQVDLIGCSFFTFVLPADHAELEEHFSSKCCSKSTLKFCQPHELTKGSASCNCSFFIRMKSTQTRRSLGIKSSGYKVVHITGHVINRQVNSPSLRISSDDNKDGDEEIADSSVGFAGLVRVLSHTPMEMSVDELVFVVRIDQSFRITYCEDQIQTLSNYSVDEVKGCTVYRFIHTCDLNKIRCFHTELLEKGHVVTSLYRWLLKNGSYLVVQSRGSLLQDRQHIAVTTNDRSFSWITYVITQISDEVCSKNTAYSGSIVDLSTTVKNGKTNQIKVLTVATKDGSPKPSHINKELQKTTVNASDAIASCYKFVKELPEKSHLKRTLSTHASDADVESDDGISHTKVMRDKIIPIRETSRVTCSTSDDQQKNLSSDDVLDVHSTKWRNPPNREVTNHSDLYTTVIHHHYPYGIDPNLLNSNPIFAKMLTTNYVSYQPLLQRDTFLLPTPGVNIFTPVLGTIPQLITSQPGKLPYCPPSVASIVDELRQDPMRKVNPPNKVILPPSQIPTRDDSSSISSTDSKAKEPFSPIAPHLFTLSDVTRSDLMLQPLPNIERQSSNATIFLHPIKLAQRMNSLNSLHI